MEALLVVLLIASAVGGYLLLRRGKRRAEWRPALEGAARALGGRASVGALLDQPEVRAEVDGLVVTLKLRHVERGSAHVIAAAEASLPGAGTERLYLGWGLKKAPEDLGYIPEVPLPPAFGLEPPVHLRSDLGDRAARFAEASVLELAGLKREAHADAVEVLIRGGSIRLAVHGLRPTDAASERLVRTTARLARIFAGDRALPEPEVKQLGPSSSAAPAVDRCGLCSGERRAGVPWVRCTRCNTPHHAECWQTATGCSKEGCGGAISEPL